MESDMRKAILAATLLLVSSGAAMAADNGFYLGGSVGQANLEIDDIGDIEGANFEGDDTGYKLIAGLRPLDWFGVEASYINFGKSEDRLQIGSLNIPVEIEGDGISAFAVGFLAVGPVDLFAKGGLISWDSKISGSFDDDDGTDLAYGVGAQFRVWSIGVRAEYEVFDADDVDDLSMISIGATFTFL
jgi:opacity protein-like surface antigen